MYLKILFLEYLKWVGVLKMYHYMVKPVEKAVFYEMNVGKSAWLSHLKLMKYRQDRVGIIR